MAIKEWLPLAGLAASAFIVNTSEFIPIGLLVDIAADFEVSEAQAGMLVSVYAWTVMLLSLPLMIAASRFGFKKLLLGILAVFALGQTASALAPGYWTFMAARLTVACAHAVFWSIVSPMAVRLVSFEHRPAALGAVAAGSSIAMIAGLPIGRMIGLAMGWRAAFVFMAVASLVAFIYLFAVLPKMAPGTPFAVRRLPGLVKNPALLSVYAVTAFMVMGYYACYSYVEPFLQRVALMDDQSITLTLSIFGCAGVAGSALFSRLYGARRLSFVAIAVGGISFALIALRIAAEISPFAVVAACVLWGASATAANVAFQAEIIRCVPEDASPVAMSMFSGIFNLGIGTGTAIGGVASSAWGVGVVGFVGGALVAVATALCVLLLPRAIRKRSGDEAL